MGKNDTKKFYLLGDPVGHSISPIMQKLFLDYYKIKGQYKALRVTADNLDSVLSSLKLNGVLGINITVPLKETIVSYLDKVSDIARFVGCVNTIKINNRLLEGYNTDALGFQKSLPISVKDENVLLIGAGGAARAILTSLGKLKCRKVLIFNRTVSRAEALLKEFKIKFPTIKIGVSTLDSDLLKREIVKAKLLINATSVGMKSHKQELSYINPEFFHNDLFVYDVIYNPLETKLIQGAKEKGLRFCNGLDMLIYQGLESLKIWLGQELPFKSSLIEKVRAILTQKLQD